MGCLQSKDAVINVEECPPPLENETGPSTGRVGILPSSRRNTTTTPRSSSASEISNSTTTTMYRPVEQAVRQIEAGRVGIMPPPIFMISSSSSSSSSSEDEQQFPSIKGTLVDDDEDSSSFGSNVNAPCRKDDVAANTNQSMDDLLKDESVVDWLAETTNNNSAVPFTTTKDTIGPPTSVIDHRLEQQQQQQQQQKQYPIIATQELYECRDDCHVVKDTARVERRHVPLPTDKPVDIKSGSWLTNRYVVNDYIILSNIGKGAHAEVHLCKHKRTNEVYAAKIMNKKLLCEKFVDIQKEVAIMKKLMHPNSTYIKANNILFCSRVYIMHHLNHSRQFCVCTKSLMIPMVRVHLLNSPALYAILTQTITPTLYNILLLSVNKVYLITEFAQRGDLMNIARTCNLTADHLRSITRQIMMGLQYLHNNFITHNDLKPSNILLTQDGTVKIADFGVSGRGRIRMDSCGTPSFMAPEGNETFHHVQKKNTYEHLFV